MGHLTEPVIAVILIVVFVYLFSKNVDRFVVLGDMPQEKKDAITAYSAPYWQAVLFFLASIFGACGVLLIFADIKPENVSVVLLYGFAVFCLLLCIALYAWAISLQLSPDLSANSESPRTFQSMHDTIFNSAKSINAGIMQVVYIWAALAAIVFFFVNKWAAIPFVSTAFFMLRCRYPDRRLLCPDEYYSIPESGGSKDNHRCVLCNAYGIWVRGEYASESTTAHCSKCKKPLYAISEEV